MDLVKIENFIILAFFLGDRIITWNEDEEFYTYEDGSLIEDSTYYQMIMNNSIHTIQDTSRNNLIITTSDRIIADVPTHKIERMFMLRPYTKLALSTYTGLVHNYSSTLEIIKVPVKKLNLQELEAEILSRYTQKIRLEKTLIKTIRKQSLVEFLQNFFETYNHERDTIYADTKEVQTEKGKRRSLGDIFMICRYYFPTCTLENILYLLYVEFHEDLAGFRTSYCNQINKRVWYLEDADDENEQLNKSQVDEFGFVFNDYMNIL